MNVWFQWLFLKCWSFAHPKPWLQRRPWGVHASHHPAFWPYAPSHSDSVIFGPYPEHLSFWHILSSPDQGLKSRALNDDREQTETQSQDRIPLPFPGRVAKYLLSALPMVAPRCFLLEGYEQNIVAVFLLPHFVTRKVWISEKSNYHTEWARFHRHPCGCGTQFKRGFLCVSNDSPIHSTNVSNTRIWCSKKQTQPCLCRMPRYGETGLLWTQTLVKLNTRRFLKDEDRLFHLLTFPLHHKQTTNKQNIHSFWLFICSRNVQCAAFQWNIYISHPFPQGSGTVTEEGTERSKNTGAKECPPFVIWLLHSGVHSSCSSQLTGHTKPTHSKF